MLEKGIQNVNIESDSREAVNLINDGPTENHPHQVLITDSKILLDRTRANLTHIYREANQSADHLARLGAEQAEDLVVTEESPQSVRHFVIEDVLGAGRYRD